MVTFGPTCPITVYSVPSAERSIENPVSLSELSVQLRLICVEETACAMRFEGAAGTVEVGGFARLKISEAESARESIRASSTMPLRNSLTPAAPPTQSFPGPPASAEAPVTAETPSTYSVRVPAAPS